MPFARCEYYLGMHCEKRLPLFVYQQNVIHLACPMGTESALHVSNPFIVSLALPFIRSLPFSLRLSVGRFL